MISLGWSTQKYAALNDCQIRISSGGETKKIKVLDSEPNQSLAKSPNAHWTAVCGESARHLSIVDLSFGLPPFGRVPSFGFGIADLGLK